MLRSKSNNAILHLFTDLALNVVSGSGHIELLAPNHSELAGKNLMQLFPGVPLQKFEQLKEACLQQPGSSHELKMRISMDGSISHFRWMVCTRQNVEGVAEGLIWVGTKNMLKYKVARQAAVHRSVLNALSESVITMDAAFRITGINKRAEQMFGITASQGYRHPHKQPF